MKEENPNAFKNFINDSVVKNIGSSIQSVYADFDTKKFCKLDLTPLELKARVLLITKNLKQLLPENYPEALNILLKAMEKGNLSGFSLWPFSEYISQFGLEHFDESMKGMYRLTQRFTSEFAVRPYFIKDHRKVLKYFSKWATDKNHHVRRWVSEGSRPLLPWGQKLPIFILDPTHTILLLEKLKFDEELYVRKSVANHLNDISKNHPQVVIEVLRLWQKDAKGDDVQKLQWITRHALRTLIKKGHPGALKLMGVGGKAAVKITDFVANKKKYKLNEHLNFSFKVTSTSKSSQKLIIDYAIDFMKANGKKGKKVFKLKTIELEAKETIELKKKHSLKPITTMKYYPGLHHVYLQINGEVLGQIDFYFQ